MTRTLLFALLPLAVVASITSACSYDLCTYAPCGDGGSDSDDNDGAGAQGAGQPTSECDFVEFATVGDGCGVFVDAAADAGGNGSKASPFRTINEALEDGATNIYVCGPLFDEAVVVPAATKLRGGYDCTAWIHTKEGLTELTSPADTIPLTLMTGGATQIEGFRVRARDALEPGGSSIALVADRVNAALHRVHLIAGNAQNGESGGMGSTGSNGNNGSPNTGNTPGSGGTSGCDAEGGRGGNGGTPSNGEPGEPEQDNEGTTSGATCTAGQPGMPAGTVIAGEDAGLGSIDITGFVPSEAQHGPQGQPGGGGGGGGGTTNGAGAGGAAGGCGGQGGRAGTSGGSSIAIVSLAATLSLIESSATVGSGGDGSSGGDGGMGGMPGMIGTSTGGCNGGPGQSGGTGGTGGRGAGGHAVIVAYLGDTAPRLGTLDFDTPEKDQAGASEGQPGVAAITLGFEER